MAAEILELENRVLKEKLEKKNIEEQLLRQKQK